MRRLLLCLAGLPWLLAQAPCAFAQQVWPSKPIKLIVSAAPGSLNDSIGRWYADKLSKVLGQQVIVDNKPGGANLIAMQAAKGAAPDGYTFILGTSASFATNPYLMKSLPYDALKDFVPVALVSRPGFVITVNSKLPVHSIQELVTYAKSRPEGVTVAVDGPRNFTGLTAAYLAKTIGAPLRLVSYKNIVQGAQDTAAGTTDMVIQGYGLVAPLVTRGDLRPIAITSPTRFSLLPDLPAVSETHPGFDITGWIAIFAPAGTPGEIVARVNAEMDKIIKEPDTRAWGDRLYVWVEPQAGTPQELKEFVRAQHQMWGGMVNQLGVQPE
jgi:tripartite-type tricarboxylate transporter receptor subunit TctC